MSLEAMARRGVAVPQIALGSGDADRMEATELTPWARGVERLGFDMVWLSEVNGREAFTTAQTVLQATSGLVVGSGVARSLERVAKTAGAAAAALSQQYPGRYVLGLGVSGASRERGVAPVPFLRQYLSDIDAVDPGFGLRAAEVPRVVGAYSPGLTKVAAERADGLLTVLTTPAHTAWTREALGSSSFLGVVQWAVPCASADEARSIAREALAYYLTLPHQLQKFRRLGFDESDLAPPGSDRLVDALVVAGDSGRIQQAVQAQLDAGADQVTVSIPGPPGETKFERTKLVASWLGVSGRTRPEKSSRLAKRLPGELDAAQTAIYERITKGRRGVGQQVFALTDEAGGLEGPFNAWLVSPGLGSAFETFGDAARFACTIPARWREITILVVGAHWRSSYEEYAHRRLAAAIGLSDEEIEIVVLGRGEAALADPSERAVLRLARRLVDDWGALTDDEYEAALVTVGETGLFEISLLVGYYSLLALQLSLFQVGTPPLAETS